MGMVRVGMVRVGVGMMKDGGGGDVTLDPRYTCTANTGHSRDAAPIRGVMEENVVVVHVRCQPFWIVGLLCILLHLVEFLEPFHRLRVTT